MVDVNPTVVTFYTPRYAGYALQLVESCKQHGLAFHAAPRPDQGSWVKNCAMKATVVQEALDAFKAPILWLDADATVKAYPELLREPKEDFAIYARPGGERIQPAGRGWMSISPEWPKDLSPRWFNSGTMYFRPSDLVCRMVASWVYLTETQPDAWDQWTLQDAWVAHQPTTLWLPLAYCDIGGRCAPATVIQHDMASTVFQVDRGGRTA